MHSEYITYLLDELQPLGAVSAKRMFGGHGLFLHGLMFAIIADDVLYLKADNDSAPLYQEADCERFTYMKKGKPFHLNYYHAPDATLDDPSELQHWASIAIQSADRADSKKRNKHR